MFAVLHIADFALHAVLRTENGLAGKPAALFAGSGRKSLVLATNPAARAAGVEPGMTAPQAVARCASLLIRAPQPAAEAEARAALLAVGFLLSPSIEDTAPGVCTIDLKGHTAPPEPIAATAVAQLVQLGLPATAGIARTPLLALYAARHASAEVGADLRATATELSRSVAAPIKARLSGQHQNRVLMDAATSAARSYQRSSSLNSTQVDLPAARPGAPTLPPAAANPELDLHLAEAAAPYFTPRDAVFHVSDETTFLAPLPLAAADPSPELAAIFAPWGLRTLGDLTALPRDEIVRRFGTKGLALWNRAAGGAPRPLHPVVPSQTFAAAMEFEEEIESLEPLLFVLRRFLDRLTLELRASQHVAAELALTLRLEDETQHARHFRLPEPTADAEILFRALHTHLESLQTAAAIVAVDLRLTPARPLVRQQDLFATGLRDPHGFAETLARVSALVGADRVGTPQLEDTHRPDAVKLIAPHPVIPAAAAPPLHPPLGAPLRRFRPPLPATLEFTATARQPSYVHTAAFQGAITSLRGPWRSSGDWWQSDRAWSRLEWDITLADGGLYRLLLIGEAWFVEGEYD